LRQQVVGGVVGHGGQPLRRRARRLGHGGGPAQGVVGAGGGERVGRGRAGRLPGRLRQQVGGGVGGHGRQPLRRGAGRLGQGGGPAQGVVEVGGGERVGSVPARRFSGLLRQQVVGGVVGHGGQPLRRRARGLGHGRGPVEGVV